MEISQTDPEVLRRFQRAVGHHGKICGPYVYDNKKPQWWYTTQNWFSVWSVLGSLWPFLSSKKRQQAATALARWIECDPILIGNAKRVVRVF
jgi:hypothetical protein